MKGKKKREEIYVLNFTVCRLFLKVKDCAQLSKILDYLS